MVVNEVIATSNGHIWFWTLGCEKEEVSHPLFDIMYTREDQCQKVNKISNLHKLNHCESCLNKKKCICA